MHDKNGTLKLKSNGHLWNCRESMKRINKKKKRKCEERYRDAAGWECPDNNDKNVYDRWEKSSHKNEEPCTIFFFFYR